MSARTVVFPNPPGVCNTVRRRSSSPSRRRCNDARRRYPAGTAGAVTFARNNQTGTKLDTETSGLAEPPPPPDTILNG